MLLLALIFPGAVLTQQLEPVNLGTAGDFVILAKTGISSTGVTAITGDVGVSPVAATFITGFGLIKDSGNTFSTSSLVTGKIYAADYAVPTPTKMTTAIGDMQTAFSNAAGRKSPNYTELYTGDITGKTLTPGLYKWGTAVQVNSGGVTISGSATDVWIFQIAQDLIVGNGAIVTLSGGAQVSNIFWQVAGKVALGTTAQMKGIILCQTGIAMSTGASFNGRALAQTAVTLDANTVTKPATVTSVSDKFIPQQFTLEQNYPNPFNPTSTISYSIAKTGLVNVSIYNVLGTEIGVLVNEMKTPGNYKVVFDAKEFASGVYFYKLRTGEFSQIKKMILMK